MQNYYDLLQDILDNGDHSDDRTNTGTLSSFGDQLRFDLRKGFLLLTGKYVPFNLVKAELLWILSGSANNEDLREMNGNGNPTIWEEWSLPNGDLGPVYGAQFRKWMAHDLGAIDQIAELINGLRERPHSRRHIVSAWNVEDLPDETKSPQDNVRNGRMALAPCHAFFQMRTRKLRLKERISRISENADIPLSAMGDDQWHKVCDERNVPRYGLSCKLTQRSADMFLGVPFNIASYAMLTHMVAQVVNMIPETLIVSFGDVHIYKNHLDQVRELLSRDHGTYPLPTLKLNPKITNIDDFTMSDIEVEGYNSYPAIKAPVAV